MSAFTAPIGSTITLDADYSDAGILDTHKCYVNWDDGTPEQEVSGVKDAGDPSLGSCSPARQFMLQGVYSITVYVKDDDGGQSNSLTVLVTIFDPDGGFVTGGGWIMSPPGAYLLDDELVGKANFGFVSKYKKGSRTPEGQTEFQFKAGDLNFHSSAYQTRFLVISNFKAQVQGHGNYQWCRRLPVHPDGIRRQYPGRRGRRQVPDEDHSDQRQRRCLRQRPEAHRTTSMRPIRWPSAAAAS